MEYIIVILLSYIIGSSSMSFYLGKLNGVSINKEGSKNLGASNTMALLGWKAGIIVGLHDILKAVLVVLVARYVYGDLFAIGEVAGVSCILGHIFPFYLKFKGGKGVACAAACMLILSPISFAILLPIFIAIVLLTKYVSLASIISVMLFPLLAHAFKGFWGVDSGFISLASILIGAFVVFMHRTNITRLLEGKESKADPFRKNKTGNNEGKIKAEPTPQKEYTDADFVKCTCGRLIPVSRKECVYCGERNPSYKPSENNQKKNKKKK